MKTHDHTALGALAHRSGRPSVKALIERYNENRRAWDALYVPGELRYRPGVTHADEARNGDESAALGQAVLACPADTTADWLTKLRFLLDYYGDDDIGEPGRRMIANLVDWMEVRS